MNACLSLSMALLLYAGTSFGAGRSPITITEITSGRAQVFDSDSAKKKAAQMMGTDSFLAATPVSVRYQDRSSLGQYESGTGWLVRGTVQLISREPVAINAILDGRSGRLVAAFNDSTGVWSTPSNLEYDLPAMIKQAGWIMSPEIPDTLQSTVTRVLEVATHEIGADPTIPGQVVLRPRRISPRFPARRVGEKLIPVEHVRVAWIVQVCGRKFDMPHPPAMNGDGSAVDDFYCTEHFAQLKDDGLGFASGFYMP